MPSLAMTGCVSSAVTVPGSMNQTAIMAAKMIKAIASSMCLSAVQAASIVSLLQTYPPSPNWFLHLIAGLTMQADVETRALFLRSDTQTHRHIQHLEDDPGHHR